MQEPLRIDVWSDIACPWCYVGKRRLEAALAQLPERAHVELVWRSFELDPAAPRESSSSALERLSKKYGVSSDEAQAMVDRMAGVAAADGLEFHFEQCKPSNTFDAHRVLHFAKAHGKQDALKERYFRAYLTEGISMGDRDALLRLAVEVGLDEAAVRNVLDTDAHALDVRADEEEARAIGIRGVPFFVFAGRLAVSGAESAEVLRNAMSEAFASERLPVTFAEGASCGPEGC